MYLHSYKDLTVWQASRVLTKDIYLLCSGLPKDEVYGISSQIKRAVVSIPSNIAEGYVRNGTGEYIRFLSIAAGSAAEVETQLILINDLFGTNIDKLVIQTTEVQKMLGSLIRKLNPKS